MLRQPLLLVAVATALFALAPLATAQQNAFVGGFNLQGQNNGGFQNGIGNQQGNGQGQGQGNGFRGGAANADFDSLIDLITSTIAPDSWLDNGGAAADIRPFPGGVWVDPAGVLRMADRQRPAVRLTSLESPPAKPIVERGNVERGNQAVADPRHTAKLRCISLPRLEAAILHRMQKGEPLDESMLALAGLQRIEFVFVYPEIGDLVLAGPAGDWKVGDAHRIVSTEGNAPVVRLDDLLTLLRREQSQKGKAFGCSITPRQEQLADTQRFLDKSSATPLRPGKAAREKWLEELRTTLGLQDIKVFGLDPATHAALVLVEADHHMKRIGIGLADGVVGVDSYLDTVVKNKRDDQALSVLRWWFSTNYQSIARNESGTAFKLTGQGVRVLSENELLTKRGERVHTGQADEATQQFAHQFTSEFGALCNKYPVYGELRNLFDLSIVAAMLQSSDLYATARWQPVLFLDAEHLPLPKYRTPKEVDTILNHRMAGKKKILAAVSGGVWIDSRAVLAKGDQAPPEASANLDYHREQMPADLQVGEWWWDLE